MSLEVGWGGAIIPIVHCDLFVCLFPWLFTCPWLYVLHVVYKLNTGLFILVLLLNYIFLCSR